ncbi:FeoB-associated Cys-rich membrane protein [Rhodovulum marinum]|uniref:Attachment p12 family protein n=1 Tax=Rhodovulum marinum TaxID=320662 RepID=A0A4R2PSF3_9RHOB|nr:FeoB-associated Cys-rich membrane protein [Rhodovulum marinum]TCP38863.1 hypothetical protein EV662_11617 [Rhodovulum marinum]
MNGTPQIDLAAETSIAAHEVALIAVAVVLALVFLFRGVLRRRRGAAPACDSCPGCASGTPCQAVQYDFTRDTADDRT